MRSFHRVHTAVLALALLAVSALAAPSAQAAEPYESPPEVAALVADLGASVIVAPAAEMEVASVASPAPCAVESLPLKAAWGDLHQEAVRRHPYWYSSPHRSASAAEDPEPGGAVAKRRLGQSQSTRAGGGAWPR